MRQQLRVLTIAGIASAFGAATVIVACTVVNGEVVPPVAAKTQTFPTLLSLSEGASVCRWVSECAELGPSIVDTLLLPLPPAAINTYSACVDILSGPFANPIMDGGSREQVLSCIAAATSCDAAISCLPSEDLAPGDPRCDGVSTLDDAGFDCLNSGASIHCANDPGDFIYPQIFHCSSAAQTPGETCNSDFEGCFAKKACAPLGGSCQGSLQQFCFNSDPDASTGNFVDTYDCEVQGQTCLLQNFDGVMQPICVNSAQNTGASMSNAVSCQGPVVLLSAATFQVGFPCSNFDAGCAMDPTARCEFAGAKCSPYNGEVVNICTGNSISLCLAGEPTSFDCTSIGTSCTGDNAGKNAHCQ